MFGFLDKSVRIEVEPVLVKSLPLIQVKFYWLFHTMHMRAASRNKLTNSLFSSTFVVAFGLVLSSNLMPCPVDHSVNNEAPREKEREIRDRK